MFLLAGHFVPPAYDRKGAVSFIRGRLRRVGVPPAVIVLLVHLPVVYLLEGKPHHGNFSWIFMSEAGSRSICIYGS